MASSKLTALTVIIIFALCDVISVACRRVRDDCPPTCKCTVMEEYEEPTEQLSQQDRLLNNMRDHGLYRYLFHYQSFNSDKSRRKRKQYREMTCLGIHDIPNEIPSDVKRLVLYGEQPHQPGQLADQPAGGPLFRRYKDMVARSGNRLRSLDGSQLSGARQLEQLVVRSNDIETLENEDIRHLNLTTVSLTNNGMKKIRSGAFGGMTRMETLDLSSNQLRELKGGTFTDLIRVTKINLAKNRLRRLDDRLLYPVMSLEELDLSFNKLTSLPRRFFARSESLRTLNLGGNNLREISAQVFAPLQALSQISLRENGISEIDPYAFHSLVKLKNIDISRNKLERLAGPLFYFNQFLLSIDIGENRMKALPAELLKRIPYLRKLVVNKNSIIDIPVQFFKENKNLQEIDLSDNKIKEIIIGHFATLQNVHKLDLSGNRIRTVRSKVFAGMAKLRELRLNHNGILRLEDDAFKLDPRGIRSKITWLYLQNNRISEIKRGTLAGLRYVKMLNLGNNRIKSVDEDSLFSVNHLHNFLINNNRLRSVPSNLFRRCPQLTQLSIANNRLRHFNPSSTIGLRRLSDLDLSNNHLKDLRLPVFNNTPGLTQLKLSDNFFKTADLRILDRLPKLSLLDFGQNRIRKVVVPVDYHYPLSYLSFAENSIHTLPEELKYVLSPQTSFALQRNPLSCDCHMLWLHKYASSRMVDLVQKDLVSCKTPSTLHGRKLLDVPPSWLTCSRYEHYVKPTRPHYSPELKFCSVTSQHLLQYTGAPHMRRAQKWLVQVSSAASRCHTGARISDDWVLLPAECATSEHVLRNASVNAITGGSPSHPSLEDMSPSRFLRLRETPTGPKKETGSLLWIMQITPSEKQDKVKWPCLASIDNPISARGIVTMWRSDENRADRFKIRGIKKCGAMHVCGQSSARASDLFVAGSPLLMPVGEGRWGLLGITVDAKLNSSGRSMTWKFLSFNANVLGKLEKLVETYSYHV